MNINQSTLENIKSQIDIVDLISSYIPLKRSTRNFIGLCPFHNEKTPSFNINREKGFFYCFGCNESGDAIKFISLYENLDFVNSVKLLANRYGLKITEETSQQKKQTSEKIQLYEVYQKTAIWFTNQLQTTEGKIAKAYLKNRQISNQEIEKFQIGYAPKSWDKLLKHLQSQDYSPNILLQSGLFSNKEQSEHLYDRFRHRLMFSICNDEGKVIAFSGRILIEDKEQAKYINSPETNIFKKKNTLYGFHLARRHFSTHKFAVICEGQIDVIACHRAGLDNTISSQGTAFTEDHAVKIKRYTDDVVMVFDGDEAGKKATIKSIDSFVKVGLIPKVCQLKDGLDPDSIVKKYGEELLRKNITNSQDYFSFAFDYFRQIHGFDSPSQRTKVTYELAKLLTKITEPIKQSFYIQDLAHKLQLTENDLRTIINNNNFSPPASNVEYPAQKKFIKKSFETIILELSLSSQEVGQNLAKELNNFSFSQTPIGEILAEFLAFVQMGEWKEASEKVMSYANKHNELASIIIENQYENLSEQQKQKAVADCLTKFLLKQNDINSKAIIYQLNDSQLSDDAKTALLHKYQQLKVEKKNIKKKNL